MDDLYALDGGGSATAWQRKHNRRKHREAALKTRRRVRAEAKLDLKKRTKKWRTKWKKDAAANKAAGLPPPSRHGRPRDMSRPQWVEMTGRRYGRWTVMRVAPVSMNGKNHGRYWYCRCDCGLSGERAISGTTLREGISTSCGCYRNEVVKNNWRSGKLAKKMAERRKLAAKPLRFRLSLLRRKIVTHTHTTKADAQLLTEARKALRTYELRLGIVKPRKPWRTQIKLAA